MKFIMIIIVCISGTCDLSYNKDVYFDSYEHCIFSSAGIKKYYDQTYPQSSCEIHCMEMEEFLRIKPDLQKRFDLPNN